jgi:hypothetical protein
MPDDRLTSTDPGAPESGLPFAVEEPRSEPAFEPASSASAGPAPLSSRLPAVYLGHGAPILIDDATLGRTPVSGVLVLDDQDAVLRRLALLLPLRALPSKEAVRLQRDSAARP